MIYFHTVLTGTAVFLQLWQTNGELNTDFAEPLYCTKDFHKEKARAHTHTHTMYPKVSGLGP